MEKWKEVILLRGVDVWKPEEALLKNGKERRRDRGTIASIHSSRKSSSDAKSDRLTFS